ncbi:hypothetical protein V2J09_007610 [Rumex salicifolius]
MEIEDRILIITDSISVNAALVFWVFKNFSVQLHNLSIITQASLLEDSLCFKPGSVSSVVSISAKPGFHTQLWLKELAKVLKLDGFLLVQEPSYLNHNKQIMLGDSRASLERNLLFAGFYSIEGFPCLNYDDEISFHSQQFELIAMKAKKAFLTESVVNLPNPKNLSTAEISTGCHEKETEEVKEPENLPKEGNLVTPSRPRKRKSNPDNNVDVKEKIRERNRLYQRRRRERMTEEEKNREKERRKQYMQKRRIQPSLDYFTVLSKQQAIWSIGGEADMRTTDLPLDTMRTTFLYFIELSVNHEKVQRE